MMKGSKGFPENVLLLNENKTWSNLDMLLLKFFVDSRREKNILDKHIFPQASIAFGRTEKACSIRYSNIENGTVTIDYQDPAIKHYFSTIPTPEPSSKTDGKEPSFRNLSAALRAIESEYEYMADTYRKNRELLKEKRILIEGQQQKISTLEKQIEELSNLQSLPPTERDAALTQQLQEAQDEIARLRGENKLWEELVDSEAQKYAELEKKNQKLWEDNKALAAALQVTKNYDLIS